MCSWAPYLFDYKPRFIKFFSSFHAAYNHGRLTFFILLFYRKLWMTLSLFLATFCRPNYSFAFDFLQHHVHIRHRRGYVTSFWIVCVHIFAFCNLIYWHVPCTYLVFQFVHFCDVGGIQLNCDRKKNNICKTHGWTYSILVNFFYVFPCLHVAINLHDEHESLTCKTCTKAMIAFESSPTTGWIHILKLGSFSHCCLYLFPYFAQAFFLDMIIS